LNPQLFGANPKQKPIQPGFKVKRQAKKD